MTTIESVDISKSKISPVSKRVIGRSNNGKKRSINAQNVAKQVIDTIGKGKPVVLKEIILANGYSKSVAESPEKVTDTWSYKEAMATYEQKLVKLRDKTIDALSRKDLPNEKTFDLTGLFKVTDHSTALIQGKSTENIAHKSEVVVFGTEDFLSRQLNNGSVKPQ